MASSDSVKTCQVDDDACKRDAQALCFHCSKNVCRIHLLQHAQLMEEKTQVEMNLLADRLNGLSSRLDSISISPDILQKPFEELEKWSVDAHQKIDQIVEIKRREVSDKIEEYRTTFASRNDEQIQKINLMKNSIAKSIVETDITRKQLDDLKASIDQAERYLQSLNTHTINVITSPSTHHVHINTQRFDCQPVLNYELKYFKITYIRLNGSIQSYYVKTKKDGLMSDLMNSFVRQYNILEVLTRVELNSNQTVDLPPKYDFIQPVQVWNYRTHQQYNIDTKLSAVRDNEMIFFYELAYSYYEPNSQRILMPCQFRRLSSKVLLESPIYLSVPRNGCKGQDVLDALLLTCDKLFAFNPGNDQNLYNATLVYHIPHRAKKSRKALNDVLEDVMDFDTVRISLEIDIDNELARGYETNKFKYEDLE